MALTLVPDRTLEDIIYIVKMLIRIGVKFETMQSEFVSRTIVLL